MMQVTEALGSRINEKVGIICCRISIFMVKSCCANVRYSYVGREHGREISEMGMQNIGFFLKKKFFGGSFFQKFIKYAEKV